MTQPKVSLDLSNDEALVLLDWLRRFNQNASSEFEDQAEQRVLWDIEAMLESALAEPFDAKYDELLAAARARVRDADD
jgi:hypothetical protein